MESLKERVRARPAWEAPASTGFGALSWALGLVELLAPRAVLRWMGVSPGLAPLVRGFGLREIGAGVAILQNPMGPQFMWGRVAGDALDLLALGAALRGARRPDRVRLAIGAVGAIALLDLLMSARLTQVSAAKTAVRGGAR